MSFHYKCDVRPGDFWRMSMSHTYHTPMGVGNIVFTIAMILLTYRFWSSTSDVVRTILILLILIFPVFQPVIVFLEAKNKAKLIPEDLELTVNEKGITVHTENQSEKIRWKQVKGLILERNMVILRLDKNSGYFLPNRVLREEREAFIEFVQSRIS